LDLQAFSFASSSGSNVPVFEDLPTVIADIRGYLQYHLYRSPSLPEIAEELNKAFLASLIHVILTLDPKLGLALTLNVLASLTTTADNASAVGVCHIDLATILTIAGYISVQ